MSVPARYAQGPVPGKQTASASRTPKQNVWSGLELVSQSVSCCHTGECSLVFSKDLLTKYIVWLNGLEWYDLVLAFDRLSWSQEFYKQRNLTAVEWIMVSICWHWSFALHSKLFLERSAWNNWTIKCVLTYLSIFFFWNGSFWATINRFMKL